MEDYDTDCFIYRLVYKKKITIFMAHCSILGKYCYSTAKSE